MVPAGISIEKLTEARPVGSEPINGTVAPLTGPLILVTRSKGMPTWALASMAVKPPVFANAQLVTVTLSVRLRSSTFAVSYAPPAALNTAASEKSEPAISAALTVGT